MFIIIKDLENAFMHEFVRSPRVLSSIQIYLSASIYWVPLKFPIE